jgi:hypothetical protein
LWHKIYGNYYGIFFLLAFLQMLTAVVYGDIIIEKNFAFESR